MMGRDSMRDCATAVWEALELYLYMTRLDSAELRAQWASSVRRCEQGSRGGGMEMEMGRGGAGRKGGVGEEGRERRRGRGREGGEGGKEERKRISTHYCSVPISQRLSKT